MIYNAEDILEHYGKKGMRWGQRKTRSEGKVSSDYKKTVPHRGKSASQLSNKQLKTVNERLNLEQNYKRLNPSKVAKGHKATKEILALVATAGTIITLANTPHGKATIAAGRKFLEVQRLQRAALASARLARRSGQMKLF